MDFFTGKERLNRNSKPYLVAEIGLNHNADIEIGKRTIQKAKDCGADAVKFQTYITEEFIDPNNPDVKFLFDIFKEYELDEKTHRIYQKTAVDLGLNFFSTPLCNSAVDLLESLNVPIYKIASGDIVNKQLLTKCIQTKKPLVVSTGAALPEEVLRSIEFLKQNKAEVCLLHCVSMYPTPVEKVNLKSIPFYLDTTDYVVGFSDHSSGTLAASVAVGMGATMIEKHFTLDQKLPGPDHQISMDPESFSQLSKDIHTAYQMRGDYGKKVHSEETGGWFYGRRSIYKSKNQILAMRPALHTKDKLILDSWNIDAVTDPTKLSEGPVKFSSL